MVALDAQAQPTVLDDGSKATAVKPSVEQEPK